MTESLKFAASMYSNVIHSFVEERNYTTVGYARPWEKGTDPLFINILSLSDLVAGSLEHYFTHKKEPDKVGYSEGANEVLTWLANHGLILKNKL